MSTNLEENKVTTKVCVGCGRELSIDNFKVHNKSNDGYSKECKECSRRRRNASAASALNPLEKFTARQLIEELKRRGYEGELTYTEVKVHKINLNNF